MRTTIELPVSLRQKLVSEAASRGLKGFSQIITEALCQYFETAKKNRMTVIKNLKGCLTEKDYEIEMKRISESRGNWKI